MKKRPVYPLLFLFLSTALLFSCQGDPALAPTGVGSTIVTATTVTAPTPTTPPTSTPAPPPTLLPPPTATPLAASAAQDATAVSTTEPTPTAPIAGLIGPDSFPENVNPLTGLAVADPRVLARRPLAIKISNAPPLVRPQTGLNRADLLFEHLAEGGYTRFTAVFYSQDAEVVGSIRSGRLIDLEIPVMYDAAFAYSGSSGPVRLMFRDSSFFPRIISPDFAHGGFFRVEDPDKAVEHTLFTNTYNLRFILDERGEEKTPEFQNGMAFWDEPPFPGESASRLELRYPATTATWVYSSGRYLRWTDGAAHLDAATGAQLSFKNVVLIAAHHQETDILEDTVGDGNYSIQIQIWG
jgi:hypothetical protein